MINTVAGGGGGSTSLGPGLITGIAADPSGNVFLAIANSSIVVRLDATTNALTTVAGTGIAGYSGDNNAAIGAQLNGPLGLALDSSGNLYIADAGNNRVRKVSNGTITTVAGNGNPGYSGDDGPATSADVGSPLSVALDASGNLYIGQNFDEGTGSFGNIRKVSNGTITGVGFVDVPISIASDPAGDVFAAYPTGPWVEEISKSGAFSVVAGSLLGFGGDGGPATSALLNDPSGVAVDSSGNIYIADTGNNRVRKVSNGTINTIAGNGTAASSGDGGQATAAELDSPLSVAVDAVGNLYIVEFGQRVRKISATNGIISTLIGAGANGSSGDGGPAISTELSLATSVAVYTSGNLYFSEAGSQRVRKVSNGIITTVAGNGTQGYSGDGGSATSAQLSTPTGLTVTASGDLYIADTGNSVVRKVSSGVITTVAGNGTPGLSGDGGPATSAQLKFPVGVAVDSSENVYIADTGNWLIRKVSNGAISTFFARPPCCSSTPLHGPSGLALDGSGNLYVADSGNDWVRKISPNGTISTVAGLASWSYCCAQRGYNGDNIQATTALLYYPVSIAVDTSGNLYIADALNQRIREVSNGVIATVAGSGTAGFSGDGGLPASAELTYPSGIAVDANGNLYIADAGNARIRAVSIAPIIGSLSPSSTFAGAAAFTLTVKGSTFQTGSIVEWNGTALATTFVSNAQLSATVPTNLIDSVNNANITVVNAQSASSAPSSFSVVAPFSVSSNPTSLTISSPGGSANATLTIPPAAGFSGTVTLSCTVSYAGQGTATDPPTCQLGASEVSISPTTNGSATLKISTTPAQQARVPFGPRSSRYWPTGSFVFLLAISFVPIVRRNARGKKVLPAMAIMAGLALLPGCGGGGSGGGNGGGGLVGGTTTGNYTVTTTASSGGYNTTIAVPLTVQ